MEKIEFDFSKYEILEKRDDLITYKYSNTTYISNHNLVYQYFYDDFSSDDYKNAYVILFIGKIGDGKTTAINAFFNVLKGITLNNNYRFILICESKKYNDSTKKEGIHLYYVKDYESNPVIIIDSQGFGDSRGLKYDEIMIETFRFIFSSVIDRINTVVITIKCNTIRLDILTKYVFSSITNLFSKDIIENLVFLGTFANKSTIKDGPNFVKIFEYDNDLLNIVKMIGDKWWYAVDSISVLDNDKDKLTNYSFQNLNELYKTKVKIFSPIKTKNSADLLNDKMELKTTITDLNNSFQKLLLEKENLKNEEKIMGKFNENLSKLEKIESDVDLYKYKIGNKAIKKKIKQLKYDENRKCTHCDNCKSNCHDFCDCSFSFLGRCTIFGIFTKYCKICGCSKDEHNQDYFHYILEDLEEDINKLKIKNSGNNIQLSEKINEIKHNKNLLISKYEQSNKKKDDINNDIQKIEKDINLLTIKIKKLNEKIKNNSMNNNHEKITNEYIDYLEEKLDFLGVNFKDN